VIVMTTSNAMEISSEKLTSLLNEVKRIVGEEHVTIYSRDNESNSSGRNVSLFRSKYIQATISPKGNNEIIQIIGLFNNSKVDVKLNIISTGRNWGLGSSVPAQADGVTLDLRRMSAIREINLDEGWAIVEPGVTQLTLAEKIKNSPKMLNVTASSGHTSLLGNILDRGVGLRRQRTEDLLGLEIISPTGETIKVGWWPSSNRGTAFNPLGHGPSLLHLFTQSNLGIVTGAVVKLLPRPQYQVVLRLRFPRDMLMQAVDLFREWYAQEMVSGVLKIYDTVSTESYGGAVGEHLALICISGNQKRVKAITEILHEEAIQSGIFTNISNSSHEKNENNDFVLRVVEHAYSGDPSWNEHMLRSATGQDADNVDNKGGGWIFFLAFIPFNGKAISDALTVIEDISLITGIKAGTTVNALSSDVIDLVVSIKFSQNPTQIASAHRTLDLIYENYTQKGFYPYRLDIEHIHYIGQYYSATERELNKKIKDLLDPNGLIANGRYA
jgi:4-cresol dehydrogenase (hydroxylating)